MSIDRVKAAAALSLIGLISISLILFARSRESSARPIGAAPVEITGGTLPEDHLDLGPATLFEARFEELTLRLAGEPDDYDAILGMAQLLQDAHRPVEAAPFYEQFLEMHPDSGSVWLYLANAYGAATEWEASADATSRMLTRLPGHAGGLYNMGAALANQGKYDDARRWWREAAAAGDPIIAGQATDALGRLPES